MSRIGKKPVEIPSGVKVESSGGKVKVSGKLGTSEFALVKNITVKVDESSKQVEVENTDINDRRARQMHGTTRALIANMIEGVSKGFERKMAVYGTGYSVNEQGGKLVFQVGYCNAIERKIPQGVKVNIEVKATRGNDVPATFTITSIDKCLLGQFAADVRSIRTPEPYKGKGIRYADEHVRRKVGKAFASGTGG
ncbi:MAG: 50S ribosomal protein L6 [Phycisphaerae bacterium]|jgi:large subunit ribosomal protein L6